MPDVNDVREWLRARCDEALLAADAAPDDKRTYWTGRLNEAHDALRDFEREHVDDVWDHDPALSMWLKENTTPIETIDKCFALIPFVAPGDDDAP